MARLDTPRSGTVNRDMVAEAFAFLDTLDHERMHQAVLPFDSAERLEWSYASHPRAGLTLRDMNDAQRGAALRLMRTALSESGYASAEGIMALEEVLKPLEPKKDYDGGNFSIAVFGSPEGSPPWAWRIDGHHLSLSFTVVGVDEVVVTPHFMGASPAVFEHDGHRIHSVLGAEETLGREIMRGLSDALRQRARLGDAVPTDIITGPGREDSLKSAVGLPVSLMPARERRRLLELVEVYAHRLHPDLARKELDRLAMAGSGLLHFAWAGSLEPGCAHYYRIHGPTLLIEYDNLGAEGNHIHTVWHQPGRDFGRDALRSHDATGH
jgi:hypothetical protein